MSIKYNNQNVGLTLPGGSEAEDVSYNPTISGASATNVQDALDEAFSNLDGKQDTLTFDDAPAASSPNPVQSGGVYSATAGYGLGVMLNTQTAIADCDSVSVTGWFNTDNNTLHCPTGANKNSVLYCVTRGAAYAYQEFYDPFNAKLYRRWKNQASPWEAWYLSDNGSPAFEQQLAYVETGTTASRAYTTGEYFCWNGLLYRAKTAISSGATFTVNTNCEQVTVGGLNLLSNPVLVRSKTLSTSISTGLNEWTVAVDSIPGYTAVGVVGMQFAAIPRDRVTIVQFYTDGTSVTLSCTSTVSYASGRAVSAFVLYAKN